MEKRPDTGFKGMLSRRSLIFLFVFLVLAGLAGNRFPFSILNAHFIFGSFFAMLALQLLGFGPGIAAGFIISGYTYLAWNHPWAVITMTAEIVTVGLLCRNRKMSLPFADTLYWLFIGIPVGYLCFHIIADFNLSNTLFLLTKQAVNGIANCLAARLVYAGYSIRTKSSMISLREIVSGLFTFFVLCTAIIFLTVNSKSDFSETDRTIRESLQRDIMNVTNSMTRWISDRELAIAYLAELAQTLSADRMQSRLELIRMSDPNFTKIALVDEEATVIAYAPRVDRKGNSAIGSSYRDRPHFAVLKKSLEPMLSSVMVSRLSPPDPIAIMLVPVVVQKKFSGFVGGVMNFDRILETLRLSSFGQKLLFTLLDKNGNVIITNRSDQQPISPFSRGKGQMISLDHSTKQFIPALPHLTSTIQLWGKSSYVAETTVGSLAEWKLILEQPVEPFQLKLYNRYTGKFSLIFSIVMISLLAAEVVSRRIYETTEKLGELTVGLPEKLSNNQRIVWPASAIWEVSRVIDNFKEMAAALERRIKKISQLNESLEDRIKTRTQELAESEKKYRNMMEAFIDPLYINSADFNVEYMNPAMIDRVGKDKTGEKCYRAIHGLDSKCEGCISEKVAFSQITQADVQSPLDGRNYHLTSMPVQNRDGSISRMTIFRDITDYLDAVTEKEKALAQLVQAQKMEAIGNLAGGIAHDFNNILSSIIGFTELALDGVEKGSLIEDNLQEVFTAGRRAKELVEQILAFARQSEQKLSPIQIGRVVEEALKLIRSSIPTSIEIKSDINSDSLIMGNQIQVNQIMLNLCTNAAFAMEEKGGILSVSIKDVVIDSSLTGRGLDLDYGNYIELSVSDTGTGISPEIIGSIFDPFFTTKGFGEGTGMGIAVVHGIVESYGGKISVESTFGRGTVFTLYLPVTRKREPQPAYAPEALPTGTEHILFVDDEAPIVKMGGQVLERLGYRVTTRTSSTEALDLFKAKPDAFDLVITDMTMPSMTGDKLAAELIHIRPDLPVILCTGYSKRTNEAKAADMGIKAFAYKPIVKADLARTVRKVLDEAK